MQLSSQVITEPLKLLFTGLVDLVYPPLCLTCEQRLTEHEDQLCQSCLENFNLLNKPHAQFSVPGKIYINTAWALFDFDQAFQNLIHHLKYSRRRKPVLTVLDHYRSQILEQLPHKVYDLVISIPLHPRKHRERGYNQVDDMSQWLSQQLEASIGNELVGRAKYTKSQTQLTATERFENMENAFVIKDEDGIQGQRILLVDDVLTTGATANALAGILHENGARQVDLITLSTPQSGKA